jgi:bifunctional ADP-heptose synthase (sugar kinase/adenylyltransferase)
MNGPQKWQGSFNIEKKVLTKEEKKKLSKKEKAKLKTDWKNKLKEKAKELFPDLSATLKTADALLIMDYGRRTLSEEKA